LKNSQLDCETVECHGIVEGRIVSASSAEPGVFNWDNRFVPLGHRHTLHELRLQGLKCSARDVALSRYIQFHLDFKSEKGLLWSDYNHSQDQVDLSYEGRVDLFIDKNPYLSLVGGVPQALLKQAVSSGIFFRRKTNRRDGNYWQPGLNGGLPYTPKPDPIHEVTYLFHDLCHHLMPDLCYDGSSHPASRMVYMVSRMMSEAWAMVFADMIFVDELQRKGVDYDWSKRVIYPLFQKIKHLDLRTILGLITDFVVLGRDSLPDCPEKAAFVARYTPMMTADWRWTSANWDALVQRTTSARRWVQMAGGVKTFRKLNLLTLSDAIIEIQADKVDLQLITKRLFDFWYNRIIVNPPVISGTPHDNAIRRWSLGQLAAYSRYHTITPFTAGGQYVVKTIMSEQADGAGGVVVREVLNTYFEGLNRLSVISDDDRRIFCQAFPHFDPFFVDYRGEDKLTVPQVLEQVFNSDKEQA
jgi:hypothetical protein